MSIVHQSARRGTASSTSSESVCCRSSVSVSTTLASARNASASSRWRCSVRSKSVATAATISPPASRTGSALSETRPARAVGADHVDLDVGGRLARQRAVDELGVRARDRALGRTGSEQLLRALVREQQLARGRLGDDHAERQLAHQRRQPLALAMRLLVERAVVERERPRGARSARQLRLVAIRDAAALPAERERAERAPAHDHGHRRASCGCRPSAPPARCSGLR